MEGNVTNIAGKTLKLTPSQANLLCEFMQIRPKGPSVLKDVRMIDKIIDKLRDAVKHPEKPVLAEGESKESFDEKLKAHQAQCEGINNGVDVSVSTPMFDIIKMKLSQLPSWPTEPQWRKDSLVLADQLGLEG